MQCAHEIPSLQSSERLAHRIQQGQLEPRITNPTTLEAASELMHRFDEAHKAVRKPLAHEPVGNTGRAARLRGTRFKATHGTAGARQRVRSGVRSQPRMSTTL